VEVLRDRRLGIVHLDNELQLEDVLDFLAVEADRVWHCDCCPRGGQVLGDELAEDGRDIAVEDDDRDAVSA
jgi:hypothetical protein